MNPIGMTREMECNATIAGNHEQQGESQRVDTQFFGATEAPDKDGCEEARPTHNGLIHQGDDTLTPRRAD